eukprot:Seg675.35 transcript_id=Seg675.35/GoldUCD/mRNA.D3Y31 product="Chordin-like protein 1" protein_id=Seg675.35/GoldUCD/D3Y31
MRLTRFPVSFLVYSLYLIISFGAQRADSYCWHNGKSYSVGQMWRITSARNCRQCKCFQGSLVRCLPTCSRDVHFPLSPLATRSMPKTVSQRGSTGVQCTLEGKTHSDGEGWTEGGSHSKGLAEDQCMQCNCKVQVITCAIRRCPELKCHNPVSQHGTCCKICPERSARPPRESAPRGCTSIGRYFENNESWQLYLPSRNVFATCVDCNCMNGREHCRKHSCPRTKCSKPVKRPGDCCALCPGQRRLSARSGKEIRKKVPALQSGIFGLFLRRTKNKSAKDKENSGNNAVTTQSTIDVVPDTRKGCRFGVSSTYKHTALFYPVLNGKVQKCTKCVCMNSVVKCARIRCPSRYPCKRPIAKEGFCCKMCPGMSDKEAHNLEAIQMYQNRGCMRAKRSHVQVYRYDDVTSSAAQLSAKYLFDKSHQQGNKRSEVHHLQLINMNINVTRAYLDDDDIIRNSLDKNWGYLGAIKGKMFARFLRHEKDLERCRDAIKCIKKLTHMVDQMKTKAARRRRCRSSSVVRSSLKRLQK